MKKRILSGSLALVMLLTLLPTAAFAENAAPVRSSGTDCTCTALCSEENRNADCPVCGAQGASAEVCEFGAAPAADPAPAAQIITAWTWVDEDEVLNDGGLAVNADTAAADVIALLPTAISATVEGVDAPQTLALGAWGSASYNAAVEGFYPFAAALPEGCSLADGVAAPEVTVQVLGVSLLENDPVSYIDFDENGKQLAAPGSVSAYTAVDSNMTAWGAANETTWYVVNSTLEIADRITVTGDVCLLLMDSFTLTAPIGITVNDGEGTLTIYGQTAGTGKLDAGRLGYSSATANTAGLGGANSKSNGLITINGGTINAKAYNGAGIGGGGRASGSGTVITINGGTVTAQSNSGAGIGGGLWQAGTVSINGGVVEASSANQGAGIGGGCYTAGTVTVNITGGAVTATGGTNTGCAAIGRGNDLQGTATCVFTAEGNAVIYANGRSNAAHAITDQSYTGAENTGGVIFENNSGVVYGDCTVTNSFEIPSGKTLTIPVGAALTIPEGITLTNKGSFYNAGTFTNNGNLDGAGPVQPAVSYVDFDENGVQKPEPGSVAEYTAAAAGLTAWGTANEITWYVVSTLAANNLTVAQPITVAGDVRLILIDGCKLTAAQGIAVKEGSSLTVYGQNAGTGALSANAPANGAALGSSSGESAGTITVNGGVIAAEGVIGCFDESVTGTVVVRDGVVTAGDIRGGSVVISRGNVTVSGSIAGSFSTGANGNAVVFAGAIADQTGESGWSGIMFKGDSGAVYGRKLSLLEDFAVPTGKTLTVPSGTTLVIPAGVTLTNNGTIINQGNIKKLGEYVEHGHFEGSVPVKAVAEYIDFDAEGNRLPALGSVTEYTAVDSSLTTWGVAGTTTWYVVDGGGITIPDRVIVNGDVRLILVDGYTLTAEKGVTVNRGTGTLTIYGQTEGTGKLIAGASEFKSDANLGGTAQTANGLITINGGTVTTNGFVSDAYAAVIGGGNAGDGFVTINGGTVNTNINILGAGIGGGSNGNGTVVIHGGTVNVIGDSQCYSAGIGGGSDNYGNYRGNVTITGGTVTVQSGRGAAIGGANGCSGTVTISGGLIYAASASGASIGNGYNSTKTSEFTATGNAVIFAANSITDQSYQRAAGTSGVIFEGSSGTVYGAPTVTESFELSAGMTLAVPSTAELRFGDGVTITNKGTINLSGTLDKTSVHNEDAGVINECKAVIYLPGAHGSGTVAEGMKLTGTPLTLPTTGFTRTGYTQTGWAVEDNGSKVYDMGDTYTADAAITLYPVWTAKTSTVTLDGNGATTAGTASVNAAFDSAMPAITPPQRSYTVTYDYAEATGGNSAASTAAAYAFLGYYDAQTEGAQYYSAAGASAKVWDREADAATLYAQWTAPQLTLPVPIKTGYTFAGWYSGQTRVTGDTPVTGDVTYTASWSTKSPVTITETAQAYDYNGGEHGFVITGTDLTGFSVAYKVSGAWVTDIPTDAGSYDVKVTRAEDDTYVLFETTIVDGLVINALQETQPAAPTINYSAETLSAAQDLSWRTDGAKAGTYAANTGRALADFGWDGSAEQKVYFFKAATDHNHTDSEAVTVTIPARPTAPASALFTVTRPVDAADGKLSAAAGAYEYRTSALVAWTSWDGGEISAIADGTTFSIRYPANQSGSSFASPITEITVASKTKVTIRAAAATGLSYNGSAQTGYTGAVTVTDALVDANTLVYHYESADNGSYDSANAPKNAGSYKLTISVPDSNNTYAGSTEISFTIAPKELTVTGLTATNRAYNGLTAVALTGGTLTGVENSDAVTLNAGGAAGAVESPDASETAKSVTVTGFALNGNTDENYTLKQPTGLTVVISTAEPSIRWGGNGTQTTIYTGGEAKITAPTVTLVNGETYSGDIQYAYSKMSGPSRGLFTDYTDGLPTDAGAYRIKAHINAAGNYAAADSGEMTLTIEQSQPTITLNGYAPDRAYNGKALANPTAAQLTITGAKYGDVAFTWYRDSVDVNNTLPAAPMKAGSYVLVASVAETNNTKAAAVASGAIIISTADLTITAKPQSITYGQSIATGTAQVECGALANGETITGITLTASSDQAAAANKTITPGAAVISGGGAGNYNITYRTGALTITPLTLTWDASGLWAAKQHKPGDTTAAVNGTLRVSGALKGENPGFTYDSLTGAYASDAVGSQTVTVTVAGKNLSNTNYALPSGDPAFTGAINAVSDLTPPASEGDKAYKLEKEEGISAVPAALQNSDELNTPAKIETKMNASITEAAGGIPAANIKVYDVTLKFSTDKGKTWTVADETNFPVNGIPMVLPYPAGAGQNGYDFVITHMITTGERAGATETILPTKTADGLRLTVTSLSPIAVGYKETPSSDDDDGSSAAYYTITAEAGTGGSFHPAKTVSVKIGESASFTVVPGKGYAIADVKVDGKSVGAVNSYVFTNVRANHTISAAFKAAAHVNPQTGLEISFSDVSESDWFYEAVMAACENGWFAGTSATTFGPNAGMTRQMLWTVLGRISGEALSGGSVYEAARTWAMGAGITDGSNPAAALTREQLVTILWRYAGSPAAGGDLAAFSDAASVSAYAIDAMKWAVANGIVAGSDGKLMPQGSATRAQVAAMLSRCNEKLGK